MVGNQRCTLHRGWKRCGGLFLVRVLLFMMSRRADAGPSPKVKVPAGAKRANHRASPDLAIAPDFDGETNVTRDEIQRLFDGALRVR